MNTYVVWVEREQSKIFKVRAEGPEMKLLRRHEIRHHTPAEPENKKNCDKFFGKIATAIRDADEILLMGPSLTKEHFKKYLDDHEEVLGRSVVGSLNLDLESDAKLLARSRDFFREYDVFGQSISS